MQNSGKLQLGLTGFISLPSIIRIIKIFRESYPNIEINLVENISNELINQLIDDKLDLV